MNSLPEELEEQDRKKRSQRIMILGLIILILILAWCLGPGSTNSNNDSANVTPETTLNEITTTTNTPPDSSDVTVPDDPGDEPDDPGDEPDDPGDEPDDPGDEPDDPGEEPDKCTPPVYNPDADGEVINRTTSSVTIAWNNDMFSDDVGITQWRVYLDGSLWSTNLDPASWTSNSGYDREYTFSGLTSNTAYVIRLEAGDQDDCWVAGPTFEASTTVYQCTPPVFNSSADFDVIEITENSATIAWNDNLFSDDVGVTKWRVLRDNQVWSTTDDLSVWSSNTAYDRQFKFENLSSDTTYLFSVEAGDADDCWSSSQNKEITTDDVCSPPRWVTDYISVYPNSTTEINVSWTESDATDDVGIVEYRIYVNGTLYKTVDGDTTYTTLTGLNPSTEYTVVVVAVDEDGCESSNNPSRTETTPDPDPCDFDVASPEYVNGYVLFLRTDTPTFSKDASLAVRETFVMYIKEDCFDTSINYGGASNGGNYVNGAKLTTRYSIYNLNNNTTSSGTYIYPTRVDTNYQNSNNPDYVRVIVTFVYENVFLLDTQYSLTLELRDTSGNTTTIAKRLTIKWTE